MTFRLSEMQRNKQSNHKERLKILKAALAISLITVLYLLSFSTVQAQQANTVVPPPIQLRVYTPCQIGITFGAGQLIAPHGVNKTIGMALPDQPVQPYNYQENYVNQPTPSLTIMWWTNSSGTWLLGFYVNYTAVVDQWLTYYAFGPDSQGNQMGTTFQPLHLIGQSIILQFQVVTLPAPHPPTAAENNAWQQSPESPYMKGQVETNTKLDTVTQVSEAGLALSALAIIGVLTIAYLVWKRNPR